MISILYQMDLYENTTLGNMDKATWIKIEVRAVAWIYGKKT